MMPLTHFGTLLVWMSIGCWSLLGCDETTPVGMLAGQVGLGGAAGDASTQPGAPKGGAGSGANPAQSLDASYGPTVQVLASGSMHSCALIAGGVQCWGDNAAGQLGDKSNLSSMVPVQVQGLESGAQSIALARAQSCALVAGSAQCWGEGFLHGPSTVPTQIPGLDSGVQTLAVGAYHSCAVINAGGICWGNDDSGALGGGERDIGPVSYRDPESVPLTQVQGLTSDVHSIAVGEQHSCAVVAGRVQCWGDGRNGQLGNGSTTISSSPVQVPGLESGVQAVVAGAYFNCALVNGSVVCWGANGDGQLGNDSGTDSAVPVQVQGLEQGVQAIGAGARTACAVVNGGAFCWGRNDTGQLGSNSTHNSPVPVQVQGLESGVEAIAPGESHTCALVSGSFYCWGSNSTGQLGDGTTTDRLVPGPPIQFQ